MSRVPALADTFAFFDVLAICSFGMAEIISRDDARGKQVNPKRFPCKAQAINMLISG
jgi:hypothetical protein